MRILTYRDLGSEHGLISLLDHAFNRVFNARGVMMLKPLFNCTSPEHTYGDRFYFSRVDTFQKLSSEFDDFDFTFVCIQ